MYISETRKKIKRYIELEENITGVECIKPTSLISLENIRPTVTRLDLYNKKILFYGKEKRVKGVVMPKKKRGKMVVRLKLSHIEKRNDKYFIISQNRINDKIGKRIRRKYRNFWIGVDDAIILKESIDYLSKFPLASPKVVIIYEYNHNDRYLFEIKLREEFENISEPQYQADHPEECDIETPLIELE